MRYLIVVMVVLIVLAGCAPRGPWLFSTEAQREELLLDVGMTVQECAAKKGHPLRMAHYNPSAGDSYMALPSDFTGVAYYRIKGSGSNEETYFQLGRVIAIQYVDAPWAGYNTWSRRELTWGKR